MKTKEFARQAERETKLVDGLCLAQYACALHSAVTAQIDRDLRARLHTGSDEVRRGTTDSRDRPG
jgi:hypothetical protein